MQQAAYPWKELAAYSEENCMELEATCEAEGQTVLDTTPTDDVREAIAAALADGLTQSALARQSGMSSATLSQWLKGVYRGDQAAVQARLMAWLAGRAVEAATVPVSGARWVPTPTGQAIERALVFARARPAISVIYGGAGVGKTTALQRFAQEAPNTWIVTASPAVAGMTAMLREIASALRLPCSGHSRALSRDIRQALAGTRGLLVIDEAQHLGVPALEEIRSIHDAAGVGLVLSGNEGVFSRLTGGSRREDFAQLFSRVAKRVRLRSPSAQDVEAIVQAWGIAGRKEREYAQQIASLPGGLRGLLNMLEDATTAARALGCPVDVQMMRTAWGELGASQ